jgi:hypothetical protein
MFAWREPLIHVRPAKGRTQVFEDGDVGADGFLLSVVERGEPGEVLVGQLDIPCFPARHGKNIS